MAQNLIKRHLQLNYPAFPKAGSVGDESACGLQGPQMCSGNKGKKIQGKNKYFGLGRLGKARIDIFKSEEKKK